MNSPQDSTSPPDASQQSVKEYPRIKFRILLPLIVAVSVLLTVFLLAFLATERRNASRLAKASADATQNLLIEIQLRKTGQMVTTIRAVMNDDTLAQAFKNRDRNALFARSKPLFDLLVKEHRITHYYFHTPDRVNLLRVHRLDQAGDTINRQTLRDAQRTGEMASGIERGPLGTFVLRVVSPWTLDGQLIGYVELGVEYEEVIKNTHGLLNVDIVIAVYKKFLDEQQWNKSLKTYGREGSWAQFPDVVVMDKTLNVIPTPVEQYLLAHGSQPATSTRKVSWEDKDFQMAVFPLNDVSGKTLGEMIVLQDITIAVQESRKLALGVTLICVVVSALLVGLFSLFLGRIQVSLEASTAKLTQEIQERKHAEDQLQLAHQDLEQRVKDRTRELEAVHLKLQEASRQAGMAEVATSVLHNVGNVLNSVNVSATVISDSARHSRVSDIPLILALFKEHQADLPSFLTSDPRGQQILPYLTRLSEHLLAEHAGTIAELDSLRKNVDHIKTIVAMQQNHAKAATIKELISPVQLIEDSLRLTLAGDPHQRIQIIRDFQPVGPLHADKHKVLQILVNLLTNAAQSCTQSAGAHQRITLRVFASAGQIHIQVTDNGMGIAPENLNRIFNQGFTTKHEGHGFGLHSAAISAKEMSGGLTANSDGPGTGATFTLSLPAAPAKSNP